MSDQNLEFNEYGIEKKVYAKKAKPVSQHEKLKKYLLEFVQNQVSCKWDESLENDLPKKWKIGNLY
jgi:hypothetical protein